MIVKLLVILLTTVNVSSAFLLSVVCFLWFFVVR